MSGDGGIMDIAFLANLPHNKMFDLEYFIVSCCTTKEETLVLNIQNISNKVS